MGKTNTFVLRSRRKRGFKKRKPRMKLLPGSGRKGAINGIDFDGHEALPGETGFNARVYLREESTYIRNGIGDGYEGDADATQLEWETDETYDPETAEKEESNEASDKESDEESDEDSDKDSDEASDEESEAGDWTDEESDDYSVYSDST